MTRDELPDVFAENPLALLHRTQWCHCHGLDGPWPTALDAWLAARTYAEVEAWVHEQIATDHVESHRREADFKAWRLAHRRYRPPTLSATSDEDAEEDPPYPPIDGVQYLMRRGYTLTKAQALLRRRP